jgi:PAS domain S-box-containing protein
MARSLRLLIVDDSPVDAMLLLEALRSAGYQTEYEVVDTERAMRAALENQAWDLITSDHSMPTFSAPAALAVSLELRPDVPLIIVSGEIDLNLAVSLIRAGAQDYIQKSQLVRLVPTIDRVLREADLRKAQQRTTRELHKSESRYRRLFETAQDGILILDAETAEIHDVNPFLTNLLGYPRDQFLGKKLWEIGAFRDSGASKSGFAELKATGYIRYENLPLETSDGRAINVEFVSNVYLVDDQRVIQCNVRDISARVVAEAKVLALNSELEQRVQERTAQLNALNQELDTFNYSVSHDLGAPLHRIQGFVGILQANYADKVDAKGLELLQSIAASVTQMKILIDALFRLARLSRDQLKPEPTNLSEMVRSVAAELHQSDPQRRVEFVIAEHIMAHGDVGLLRVLLENLLDNAWKFTGKQPNARIEFGSTRLANGTVANFVRDNGAGFDMVYGDKLFGPFQRFHKQEEFPGTGIGLASAQRVVQRHGGRFWAQSIVGEGSTFYFSLNGVAGSEQHATAKDLQVAR